MRNFRGIFGILVAPYNEDGSLCANDIRREVDFCIKCGCHGLVAPVMASEIFLLTEEERKLFLRTAIEHNAGRLPFIAGVAAVSTFEAVSFAKFAKKVGADAVIALPPYIMKYPLPDLFDYFSRISDATDGLPVFIQNAPEPLGTPLSPEICIGLMKKIDSIQYVKEETVMSNHSIQKIIQLAKKELPEGQFKGVMGGKACKYLLDEHARGSCGNMAACEWINLPSQVWDYLDEGEVEKAENLFALLTPLIDIELMYGFSVYKEVLVSRGVLSTKRSRSPSNREMDDIDIKRLYTLLERVKPYFRA